MQGSRSEVGFEPGSTEVKGRGKKLLSQIAAHFPLCKVEATLFHQYKQVKLAFEKDSARVETYH